MSPGREPSALASPCVPCSKHRSPSGGRLWEEDLTDLQCHVSLCQSRAGRGEEGIKQTSGHLKSVNPSSGMTGVGLHSCFTATLSKLVKVVVAGSPGL